MTRPMTFVEAEARGLLIAAGVPLFDSLEALGEWSARNCDDCAYYDDCALDSALLYSLVSPELAGFFGFGRVVWARSDGVAGEIWTPPDRCPYFVPGDDDGDSLLSAMQRPPAEPFTVAV